MNLIVKKASTLTSDEKIANGVVGIPKSWPVESYPYVDTVPVGFEQMTDTELQELKDNNQAAYDAWLQSLRPILSSAPPSVLIHGIQSAVGIGKNIIIYTIPYTQVKITGIDIMYAESLDTVDFMILDTLTGTYSTIPNHLLNQFGFAVNISKDFFRQESNYDADLYENMQIKIVYNSQSAKTIGFNFNFSEIKV